MWHWSTSQTATPALNRPAQSDGVPASGVDDGVPATVDDGVPAIGSDDSDVVMKLRSYPRALPPPDWPT